MRNTATWIIHADDIMWQYVFLICWVRIVMTADLSHTVAAYLSQQYSMSLFVAMPATTSFIRPRQGEESDDRFRAVPTHQHIAVSVRQQIPHRGSPAAVGERRQVGNFSSEKIWDHSPLLSGIRPELSLARCRRTVREDSCRPVCHRIGQNALPANNPTMISIFPPDSVLLLWTVTARCTEPSAATLGRCCTSFPSTSPKNTDEADSPRCVSRVSDSKNDTITSGRWPSTRQPCLLLITDRT